MPTGKPQYQTEARRRMRLAQQVRRAMEQGLLPDRKPVASPSPPERRAPVDPREGELRTEGHVAKTGPRAGSRFTEIVRNGRVFHKYGDDLGTGLGPEVVEVKKPGLAARLVGANDPAMGQAARSVGTGGTPIDPPQPGPRQNETNDALSQLAAEKARLVNMPGQQITRGQRQQRLDSVRRRMLGQIRRRV
jgi:hypothetical protein